MPFGLAKNGMRMYMPSWQMQPGSAMKAANRATSDNYFSKFSNLGSNLINAGVSQTASMVEITAQMVSQRLHADATKKLEASRAEIMAGLDISV